jgi:threonine/homoserine/homoserine lactone efflux protein
MSFDQTVAFLLFAIVAAVTPGPSNVLLAATGANLGVRRGLPTLFGVAAGMGLMMVVAAFGLGSLARDHPSVQRALQWGGAAMLLWLAWKIAIAGHGAAASGADLVGFWRAAAFQWVNPKAWMVSASAAGTVLRADRPGAVAPALWLGALFVLAALPSCLVWLAGGAAVQRWLQSERAARAFNLAMGALLAASVVLFVR